MTSSGSGVAVKINRVEHRGGYKLVHADADHGKFVAKLANDSALTAGQSAHLAFDSQRTYLFRDSKLCGTVNTKGAN
jgi:ABC-type sugar transport system ATPase subunit